jgi:DNA modification methylase
VAVFREVRRVLREDGTLWLNLGDSYAGPKGNNRSGFGNPKDKCGEAIVIDRKPYGIAKQLVGIPWRVAFALQADGWYLRQDIIWHKPNPMPESVRDRCTKAHEYVFLMAKSDRYFYDADAVREEATETGGGACFGKVSMMDAANAAGQQSRRYERPDYRQIGRNRRSVWSVSTKPYAGAHFAVMPPDLVEPCIKAGCPVGGTVLDPFNGSATVGLVSLQLQRQYVGIELNPDYCELSVKRIGMEARQKRLFGEAS